jgi:hypothetical protein
MKIKVFFRPDGTVDAVHRDGLSSLFGPILKVKRVSNVEFDIRNQEWFSELVETGVCLCRHKSRTQCVVDEHTHIEGMIKDKFNEWIL